MVLRGLKTNITYLYKLTFSKHLPAYSLTCLYCAILFLSCILVSKHEISSHKYILNIILNISLHHLSVSKHAQQTKLCFKNSNKKRKALRNCLEIYKVPFHTWWDTNYIAQVQKQNKHRRTLASQTWPKQSDTAWHNLLKPVRRIASS